MILNNHNLYETRALLYVPLWQRPLFWWICVFIAIACLVLLVCCVVYAIKRRCFVRALSPLDSALVKLHMLKVEHESNIITPERFYAHLSEIIKNFIASVTSKQVQSYTDDELIIFLTENRLLGGISDDDLRALLQRNSAIKFAQHIVLSETINRDYNAIVSLITSINHIAVTVASSQK